jgi:hypothetical protein
MSIEVRDAWYIKLGRGGAWEREAIEGGTLRFGYHAYPHDLCLAGRWPEVRTEVAGRRANAGTTANDLRQVRAFYEATEQDLFVTFHGGSLWWSRPHGGAERLEDGSKRRSTLDGWLATSEGGTPLTADRLSGRLLQLQMYRGTICRAEPRDYLLDKLNDRISPPVAAALAAESALRAAIVDMMRLLTWQDFELMVDLVFSASGWRRIGALGGVQDTLDLDLVLPSTGERALVQVKSRAGPAELADYRARFEQAAVYDRLFFVWHSGSLLEEQPSGDPRAVLLGPDRIAAMVVDAGLAVWLRRKVS